MQQRSFYYSGVGTYGGPLRKFFNMILAPNNSDVKNILDTAVKDLKKHHHEDSHVLVFGFDRGAALARRFAAVARERSRRKGLKIDFLGVFDTIAAISPYSRGLGIGFSPETKPSSSVVFENPTIGDHVRKVVHLVSLDENRVSFQPTLFNYDPKGRITEVWFPGVHADVGGGYRDDGLSDLALEYMIKKVEQECEGHVRILDPEKIDYDQLNDEDYTQITKDDIDIEPLVKGTLHEHKRKTKTTVITVGIVAEKIFNLIVAIIVTVVVGVTTDGMVSGIASQTVGTIFGIMVGGIIINETISKTTLYPRRVRIAGDPPEGVHPMVHASVQRRYKEVRGYRPYALRNLKYVVVGNRIQPSKEEQKNSDLKYVVTTDDNQIGEVRQGVSGLRAE